MRAPAVVGTATPPSAAPYHSPRGWHYRGYLPHCDSDAIPQSVTFRLADSLPKPLLDGWRQQLRNRPARQANKEFHRRIEEVLDQGRGACHLRDPRVGGLVQHALRFFDGTRYHLHSWVVMPNHVHALFTPTPGISLSDILHAWKSYTAKQVNRILGRRGRFWEEDYFDRFIRDDEHFAAAVAYIEDNPVRAGLCGRRDEWPFSSAALASTSSPAGARGGLLALFRP